MTKAEARRIAQQEQTLVTLGFTIGEADALRRISMTLRRWFELECGNSNDYASWAIERDEETGKPYMVTHYHHSGSSKPNRRLIADREKGARKRLLAIIEARNTRVLAKQIVCPNCEQWQTIDCSNECVRRGFAPSRKVMAYIQGDPRGCALHIIKYADIPAGGTADQYYNRGLAIY